MTDAVLTVKDLSVELSLAGQSREVLHEVNFSVQPGRILGVVGQTGSGKSVCLRAIMGLLPANGRVTHGSAHLGERDLVATDPKTMRTLRGSELSLIPQNPRGALTPVWTIHQHFKKLVRAHRKASKDEIWELAVKDLNRLGLYDPERVLQSYPHELSGGIAQRVVMALSLALGPSVVLADEPTTALDMTVQRDILDLITSLCAQDRLGLVIVTHDLGIVANYCDDIVILHKGTVVEAGSASAVLADPQADYSRRLVAATGARS